VNEQTPKRDRHVGGVTNDQYVTPRTTLLDGHHNPHQCRHGLGARMSRDRMSAATRTRKSPAGLLGDESGQRPGETLLATYSAAPASRM
jgi:hypothetical protein